MSMMQLIGNCLSEPRWWRVAEICNAPTRLQLTSAIVLCIVLWVCDMTCGDIRQQTMSQRNIRDMRFTASIMMLCPSELKGTKRAMSQTDNATSALKELLPAHVTFEVALRLPDCIYMRVVDSQCAVHPSSKTTTDDCRLWHLAGLEISIVGEHLRQRYKGGPLLHLTTPTDFSALKYAGKRSELIIAFASQLRRLFKEVEGLAKGAAKFQLAIPRQSISGRMASQLQITRDEQSGAIKRVDVYNAAHELISYTQVKRSNNGSIKLIVHMPRGIVRVMKRYLVPPDIAQQLVNRINQSGGRAQLGGEERDVQFSIGGGELKSPRVLYHEEPVAFSGRVVEVTLQSITHGVVVPIKLLVRDEKGRLRMLMKFDNYRLNCGIPKSLFLLE